MPKPTLSRAGKVSLSVGVTALALLSAYFYQPQRYDFFPKPAPEPNPPVDPDQARLFSKGARVAVVTAHPDDAEFYLGGTLSRLAASGAKILLIVCTDGDKGYYPWFLANPSENRRVRRQEQIDSAARYQAEVVFLGMPDGRLHSDPALVQQVSSVLLSFGPEYLLSFDPEYPPRVQHNDHLQAGVAAEAAMHVVPSLGWVLRYSTDAPNFWVDITQFWSNKEALLAIHRSQFSGVKFQHLKGMLKNWAADAGAQIGVQLAEPFRVSRLP